MKNGASRTGQYRLRKQVVRRLRQSLRSDTYALDYPLTQVLT